MSRKRTTNRKPLNDGYRLLGQELRQTREAAGKTTYEVPKKSGGYFQSGHVSNVEGGFTAPSEDFIKAYTSFGGRYADLMTLLDRAKKPPQVESPGADDFNEQFLNPHTDPYILRRGYAVDLQEDISYLNGDRVPTRNVYKVSIRPLVPTAKYFVFRYGHEEDERRGVSTVRPGAGCQVSYMDESDDGTVYVVLEFDASVTDELGRCHFSWTIDIDSMVATKPHYIVHTRSPIRHVIKRIQFEAPALPEKIWWFRGSDPFGARLEPSEECVIQSNEADFYFQEFFNVENEACGMGWRWREAGER